MFAGEPPSSSDPTKRLPWRVNSVLDAFRRLLLQIGGRNIAARIAPLATYFVVVRRGKNASAHFSSARRRAIRFLIASLARARSVNGSLQ
jgi:hypothetical protein